MAKSSPVDGCRSLLDPSRGVPGAPCWLMLAHVWVMLASGGPRGKGDWEDEDQIWDWEEGEDAEGVLDAPDEYYNVDEELDEKEDPTGEASDDAMDDEAQKLLQLAFGG